MSTFEKLKPYMSKRMALTHALTAINWDNETEAPTNAVDLTSNAQGVLAGLYYESVISDEIKSVLLECKADDSLSFNEQAIVKSWLKSFEDLEVIPVDEYTAFNQLCVKSSSAWAKAKEENNYELFKPYLEKAIEYKKKFATYRNKDNKALYDIYLDDYEEGFTMEILDEFFDSLKQEIVPVLAKVKPVSKGLNDKIYKKEYPIETQKEFNKWLATYLGFDFDKGVISESAHPFTTNFHNHDVRITTHYNLHDVVNAIFSTIHETGHAIYEFGVSDEITQTPVGGGASMGMHESQSRFFENMIGRNKTFWIPIYSKLQETFKEQLSDVTLEEFLEVVNQAEPGLIRTEADELTYCLHIMVRYEIEKMIFNDEVTVDELPAVWNAKYQEYLGLTPKTDTEGILQDIHWSDGGFGYFPSYALGSAIAAQLYYHLSKEIDVEECLLNQNLKPIVEWLKSNIHQYGETKKMKELVEAATGEPFTATYYIEYLKNKYSK